MKIDISDKYRLTSDPRQVIVNERRMSDPTKSPNWEKRKAEGADPTPHETTVELSYHPSVDMALKWIIDRETRMSDATTIAELREDIASIKSTVENAVK